MNLEFIETTTFTKQITALLDDDEYRELQEEILENPEKAPVIEGGGGIRKIRFGRDGQGKSGGIRVIYYYVKPDGRVYMLVAYPKAKQEDLTPEQKATLRKLVKEL